MKCIFVTYGQEELCCCTLQAVFHPSGSKNSSLGPSALGMNFFFPWDEMQPSGCKTQFFLSIGYEIPHFFYESLLSNFCYLLFRIIYLLKNVFENDLTNLLFSAIVLNENKSNSRKFIFHLLNVLNLMISDFFLSARRALLCFLFSSSSCSVIF